MTDTVGTYFTKTPLFESRHGAESYSDCLSKNRHTVSPAEMLERRLTAPTESEELGVATLSRQIPLIYVCLCILQDKIH